MRIVHLIKEIEATIKRGPKSKSRFTTASSHTPWADRNRALSIAGSPAALLVWLSLPLLGGLTHTITLLGLWPALHPQNCPCGFCIGSSACTSTFMNSSGRKKKRGGGAQSKHYLLLITCKVGLLPLPQFLRALKRNLKEATHCFQLCKSQEQIGLKLQLWKAAGNWQPGNLLPAIQGNKGDIPPQVVTIRNPRLIYLVRPTK